MNRRLYWLEVTIISTIKRMNYIMTLLKNKTHYVLFEHMNCPSKQHINDL
jgi:hypothetical protein